MKKADPVIVPPTLYNCIVWQTQLVLCLTTDPMLDLYLWGIARWLSRGAFVVANTRALVCWLGLWVSLSLESHGFGGGCVKIMDPCTLP